MVGENPALSKETADKEIEATKWLDEAMQKMQSEFNTAAQNAAVKHPELKESIQKIQELHNTKMFPLAKKAIGETLETTPSTTILGLKIPNLLKMQEKLESIRGTIGMDEEKGFKQIKDGRKAYAAIKEEEKILREKEEDKKGIIRKIASRAASAIVGTGFALYNPTKGGLQYGALGGAAVGGILGGVIGSKFGMLAGLVAAGFGAVAAGFIGSKMIDDKRPITPVPNEKTTSKLDPAKSKALEPEKNKEVSQTQPPNKTTMAELAQTVKVAGDIKPAQNNVTQSNALPNAAPYTPLVATPANKAARTA